VTGEGVYDLVFLLIQLSQKFLKDRLKPKAKLECNVLEIRSAEGLGAAASLIIVNGMIRLGDTVVMCGANGPVTTRVRALFLPGNMREIRVRDKLHHATLHYITSYHITSHSTIPLFHDVC